MLNVLDFSSCMVEDISHTPSHSVEEGSFLVPGSAIVLVDELAVVLVEELQLASALPLPSLSDVVEAYMELALFLPSALSTVLAPTEAGG